MITDQLAKYYATIAQQYERVYDKPERQEDLEGNTHQFRTTDGGERYEVLKNFPSDSHLRKKFAHSAREIRMKRLEHYWLLSCRLK